MATTILNVTQDIVRFKDSIPYKWVLTIMGNETFNGLFNLDDYAAHRFGIFVRDYNAAAEKNRIIQAADLALQKGELEYDQWFMVSQTEDYKMGAKMLSLYKNKKLKKERKQKLQELRIQQDTQRQQHEQTMAQINAKGQWDFKRAEKETEGYKYAADASADSRIKVKELTLEGESPKQEAKSISSQEIAEKKQKLKEQEPFSKA